MLLLVAALYIYPFIIGVRFAFYQKSLIYPIERFVGLSNFFNLISDERFIRSFTNTCVWTLLITTGNLLVGMCLALLLHQRFRGRALFRSLWLLPWALPTIVASLMWRWMYEPESGILNYFMQLMGLPKLLYLSSPTTALISVIIVSIWKSYPFVMVTILAALQSVPSDLYEAASIDGAGVWQRFFRITLPYIVPVILVVTILEMIWNFNHFDIVYQLTQGGPGDSTMLLSTVVYMTGFGATRLGYASAMAVVMMLFLVILSLIYIRMYRYSSFDG